HTLKDQLVNTTEEIDVAQLKETSIHAPGGRRGRGGAPDGCGTEQPARLLPRQARTPGSEVGTAHRMREGGERD
ncbi:hypothetical protein, partial [Streptomyces sp. NPDC051776]|uniref:hypothetical protein n=1 Tax=Streptomyces sp. NPDC051776 TaxID=3155414 RepID=UPI00343AC010